MELGDDDFFLHQRQVVKTLVAQAGLLTLHLLVILLQRFEILVAARLVNLDEIDREGVGHFRRQVHVARDMPEAPVGIAVGVRQGHDHVALAGADGHEEIREQTPAVVVAHLRVGQSADIQAHLGQVRPGRLLQQRARRDTVGEVDRPVVCGVLLDEFLEARDHRDRAWEGLGQSEGPLDLLLGCCPYDLEGRHGDGVVLEELVARGLRLDIEHCQ